jgi:hypothetical protein
MLAFRPCPISARRFAERRRLALSLRGKHCSFRHVSCDPNYLVDERERFLSASSDLTTFTEGPFSGIRNQEMRSLVEGRLVFHGCEDDRLDGNSIEAEVTS